MGKIRLLPLSWLLFLSALGTIVVDFGFLHSGVETALLMLLAGVCVCPGLVAWAYGQFDPFEPVYPISIATFIYFVVMVAVNLTSRKFSMLGIDYREQVPTTIFLALLALASFYVGYYGAGRTTRRSGRQSPLADSEMAYLHRLSVYLLCIFSFMYVLWVIIARIPIWTLSIFGSAKYGDWYSLGAGPNLGHLLSGIEALPACVLLLIGSRPKRRWPLYSILILGVITFLIAGLGVRARLLLIVGGSIVFYYLEREKRPRLLQVLLIALMVFFLIVGFIGHYRGAKTEEFGRYQLSNAWDNFVEGSDIVTTTAMYVRLVPVYGYDWGRDFLLVVMTPIPSAIWPNKYLFFGHSPMEDYRTPSAAAACFIEFYRSFGSVAVVFGMGLIGWLCRKVYSVFQANPKDLFAQISLALFWAFLFHAYGRHSVTLIAYGSAFTFAPIFIAQWLIVRRRRKIVLSGQ